MIKKLQVFFIVLFISLSNTFSQAESNIKFVDIDYIFLNSAAGKIINTQIQKQSKTINDKALGYRKEINDEKKNLINQKNVLAKEEFRNKSIQLEKKINGYNKIISNENNELSIFRSKVKSEFSTQLKKIAIFLCCILKLPWYGIPFFEPRLSLCPPCLQVLFHQINQFLLQNKYEAQVECQCLMIKLNTQLLNLQRVQLL